jgi:cell division protein FtsL
VLLDRLVRGRAWIPVLGVLLAGIVFTQVEILKLGASMGRAIEQTTTLTSQNEQLRSSVATLSDDRRIERLASAMGMVLPPPGAVGYLPVGTGGDVSRALANIHTPDPSAFVALSPSLDGGGALVTGPGTSTLPPPAGAPVPPAATGVTTSSGAATALSAGTASSAATGTTAASTTAATGTSTGSQSATGTAQPVQGTTTSQTSATTSQTSATGSPASGGTGQTGASAPTDQGTGTPPTGAAAIQPASSNQQSGG